MTSILFVILIPLCLFGFGLMCFFLRHLRPRQHAIGEQLGEPSTGRK